jgi:hypothetical protein
MYRIEKWEGGANLFYGHYRIGSAFVHDGFYPNSQDITPNISVDLEELSDWISKTIVASREIQGDIP